MQLRQRARERQAEPGALLAAREPAIDLPERLEGDRDLLGRHADAGVGDKESDAALRRRRGGEHDTAARRREFHRVGEQVEHDLLQPSLVCQKHRQARHRLGPEVEARGLGALQSGAMAIIDELRQVDRLLVQFEVADLDFGDVEHIGDEAEQMLPGVVDAAPR